MKFKSKLQLLKVMAMVQDKIKSNKYSVFGKLKEYATIQQSTMSHNKSAGSNTAGANNISGKINP
jgi:hypothetical protein